MKSISFAAASLLVSCVAGAEPFSYEVSLDHVQSETDFSELDSTSLQGTWYLQPVVANDVPFAEAAFTARASGISLGYSRRRTDANLFFIAEPLIFGGPNFTPSPTFTPGNPTLSTPTVTTPINTFPTLPAGAILATPGFPVPNYISATSPAFSSSSDDENVWRAAGRFVTPNGWITSIAFSRSADDDTRNTFNTVSTLDEEMTRLSLGLGRYLGPATTVSFEYDDMSSDIDSTSTTMSISDMPLALIVPTFRSSTESSVRGYTLKAKTLIRQGVYSHALEAAVGYDVFDNDFSNEFSGSSISPQFFSDKSYAVRSGFNYVFYPRRDLGFGLGYTIVDAEFGKDKALDLSVEWFVTPGFAASVRYFSTDTPRSFTDSDGFAIGVAGRF